MQIKPINGTKDDSNPFRCTSAKCLYNFQRNCPGQRHLKYTHHIIGCYSPCRLFSTDEFCCNNESAALEVCKSLEWRDSNPGIFKKFCPNAFTYPQDQTQRYSCSAEAYKIEFGGAWDIQNYED